MSKTDVDVAVIGAGPAGMAAAISAKKEGAENVVIIERAEYPGGLLPQCIHNGFGLLYFKEDLTGPEYAERFIAALDDHGIPVRLNAMVTGLTADRELTIVGRENGSGQLRAGAIVFAMGCREKARGSLSIPGTRPAGVFTAGTAQRYVNIDGFIPGKEIVILGSGDVGMIMARRLTLEGCKVRAVVEKLPYVGGLIRNEVQCVHDFDIPLLLEQTITFIHGEERIRGVTVAKVDSQGHPIGGTEKHVPCDTLLLSVGLIPENELSMMAGVDLDAQTGGPVLDERCQTSVPGIFAAGNVAHVHDLVDNVSWQSERAGEYAARFVLDGGVSVRRESAVRPGENVRYVVPQILTGDQPATIHLRVAKPGRNATIRVGNILRKKFRVVKPSEMITLELGVDQLKKAADLTEIVVDCDMKE